MGMLGLITFLGRPLCSRSFSAHVGRYRNTLGLHFSFEARQKYRRLKQAYKVTWQVGSRTRIWFYRVWYQS
jgi:hypothetical protein